MLSGRGVSSSGGVILCTPAFESRRGCGGIFGCLSLSRFGEGLNSRCILTLELRPGVGSFCGSRVSTGNRCVSMDGCRDRRRLVLVDSVLVASCSSVVVRFITLGGPTMFFACSLSDCLSGRHKFCCSFRGAIPNPVIRDSRRLVSIVGGSGFSGDGVSRFIRARFGMVSNGSSGEVISFLLRWEVVG